LEPEKINFSIKPVASEGAFSILAGFIGNLWGHRVKLRSQRDLFQIEFVIDICYRFSLGDRRGGGRSKNELDLICTRTKR
jgi:hypothetical protein